MALRVEKKLRPATQNYRTIFFVYRNGATYQVQEEKISYIVSTDSKCSDCMVWNLTGILCIHMVVVLLDKRQVLENYCDRSLTKDMYLKHIPT